MHYQMLDNILVFFCRPTHPLILLTKFRGRYPRSLCADPPQQRRDTVRWVKTLTRKCLRGDLETTSRTSLKNRQNQDPFIA